MKDLKYLAAFSIPLVAILSLRMMGVWVFATPVFAFVLLPIFELLLPVDAKNLTPKEVEHRRKNKFFDFLLYLNLPVVFGLLVWALIVVSKGVLQTFELIGLVFSVGIVLGVNGINAGHELGHRQHSWERFLGKALLLPSLYMHFYIEHNFGHHLNAATREDPATARYRQSVYAFWFTSVFGQYASAWRIQLRLLKQQKKTFINLKNDMFWYSIIQMCYLLAILFYFGGIGLIVALVMAVVGILLLETVNYIEHYGLLRLKIKSGRYERVRQIHSWNSNHIIGRIVLYELTRHSDHHYKSTKKYQVLDCYEDSPQLPYGYPTSMVISLFPPLWFYLMNKRVPRAMVGGA